MEFKFNVNEIFKRPIVEINHNLIPAGFSGDRRALWDTVSKVSEIVNAMGEASANAQGLTKPITTSERLKNSEHKLYLLIDHDANYGKGAVTGMLKTGTKGLYVFDREGQHYQVSPHCVLDFYVHETRQRTGLGKHIFEYMLQNEETEPVKMAIDRPSDKLLGFLNKHYALNSPLKQMNNYVVFDGFFTKSAVGANLESDRSHTPTKKKDSANGLQTRDIPYGRHGAPRPPCSMGQIINNQSSTITKRQEPTGVQSMPITNCPVTQDSPSPNNQVCQSMPNICQREEKPANMDQVYPQNSYNQNVQPQAYQVCPKCNQSCPNPNTQLQKPVIPTAQAVDYSTGNAQFYQEEPRGFYQESMTVPVVQNQDNSINMVQNIPNQAARVPSYHQPENITLQAAPNQYIQERIQPQPVPIQQPVVNYVQVQSNPNQLQQTLSHPSVNQSKQFEPVPYQNVPQNIYQAINSNQNEPNIIATPSLSYQQPYVAQTTMQPIVSNTQLVGQGQNVPIIQNQQENQYLYQNRTQPSIQNLPVNQIPNLQQQQFSNQNGIQPSAQYIPQNIPQQQYLTQNTIQQSRLDMGQNLHHPIPQPTTDYNHLGVPNAAESVNVPTQPLMPNQFSQHNIASRSNLPPSSLQIQNIMDVNSNMNTTNTSLANASSMNFPHGFYQQNPAVVKMDVQNQPQMHLGGGQQVPAQHTSQVGRGNQVIQESGSQNAPQHARSDTQMPIHVAPNQSHSVPSMQGQNERSAEYVERNTHAEGDPRRPVKDTVGELMNDQSQEGVLKYGYPPQSSKPRIVPGGQSLPLRQPS